MKKTVLFVSVFVFLFGIASANAIDFGGVKGNIPSSNTKAESVTKKAAGTAVTAAINDKLKKQNCAFADSKTESQTTCDLNKIISDLKGWQQGLESTIANDVDVHIEASANDDSLAWKRVSSVQDTLKAKFSYWDWYTHKTTSSGDKLKIWVSTH